MEPLPEEIALDRPVNWTFKVQGPGVSIEGVSKMLSGLRGNETLRLYPAVISAANNERPTTALQTLLVTLPLVTLQSGSIQLPEINLPYYDPASARVESILMPASRINVFNPLWLVVQKIALGSVLLIGLSAGGYWVFGKIRRGQRKKKLLLAIGSAASADALQQALLKFDMDNFAVQNLTLQQWLQRIQFDYGADEQLALVVQQLASAQYGSGVSQINVVELAHEAAGLLQGLAASKKREL
jgi:hypothetical protein